MNNSKIAIEHVSLEEEGQVDTTPLLRRRETELIELIDALDRIRASDYWKVIYRKFSAETERLINQLKGEKDSIEMYRLQGQITRAEKLDLLKAAEEYRNELTGIRKQLNG